MTTEQNIDERVYIDNESVNRTERYIGTIASATGVVAGGISSIICGYNAISQAIDGELTSAAQLGGLALLTGLGSYACALTFNYLRKSSNLATQESELENKLE